MRSNYGRDSILCRAKAARIKSEANQRLLALWPIILDQISGLPLCKCAHYEPKKWPNVVFDAIGVNNYLLYRVVSGENFFDFCFSPFYIYVLMREPHCGLRIFRKTMITLQQSRLVIFDYDYDVVPLDSVYKPTQLCAGIILFASELMVS